MGEVHLGDDRLEEIAHQSLLLGRLLLANGAETGEVHLAVTRFAAAFGCEAHLLVTYEMLLLTLVRDGRFETKAGRHLPGMSVNMGAIGALNRILEEVSDHRLGPTEAGMRLAAIELPQAAYPRWLVAAGMGMTAACLARLFGGDWATLGIVLVAGLAGTFLRLELGRRHVNAFLTAFLGAAASGVLGGLGVRFGGTMTPALCLIAPGMIIVPGVPLINGVWDCIRNHMSLGLARLGFAVLTVAAISLGLSVAALVTGSSIPVDSPTRLLSVPEDALFSALAAIGFVLLFNIPARLWWACVLGGLCSHTLRTAAMHMGIDVATGTLLGAAAAGCIALGLARRLDVPPAALAYPGVVAMVPGSYAFRAVIGLLQLLKLGAAAPPALVAETTSLAVASVALMAAISIGLAAPLALTGTGRNAAGPS
ncbi:MAG TPA: threonine/serine exporter family protein [Aliidongia sp.]|nr:threonine/serine exporter family protein [Aliidongia sp.]